ncbi:two-component hybrid sensor and regulator [Calothrix sp. NIES-4071]|nr:two-component hybrid sensor and regulator [Calothrix sp. NIES-4071]BAZ60909.1 two-component hybrid sensor and regulator [Calothrix sp. NIES-4105]
MRLITSDSYTGYLVRRLLVAAVVVPLVLGWWILQGLRAGVFDAAFALTLYAIVLVVIFTLMIWRSAASVEKLSRQRDWVQAALNANEEKLQSFFESNVIGILFGDIYGNVSLANDEFLRMIDYSREDLKALRIRWVDITPPEYLNLETERIAEAKKYGICKPYEKELIRKDGSRIPILVGYTLTGTKREELVAFILDLSERKQVEAALKKSEERFRLAVDNIPDTFVIYDAQRRLEFVNAAALRMTNKSNEEVLGKTDEEIFPSSVTDTYLNALVQAQQTRTTQITEATATLPNSGTFTTLIKYVPILKENGELHQILAINNDITASKQVEITLRNQQNWLEYLLNLMPAPLLLIEPRTAKVIFANRAADEIAGGKFPLGKPAEEYHTVYYCTDATGQRIPDEQMPGVRVAHGERLDGIEIDWHNPNGNIRSLLIFADTLSEMYGHPATCVLMFQDISKLKEVEKALSLGYKRLQLLFGTASDLLSSQKPIALLDSVFHKLSEQIGLDCYFNYLADEPKQKLHLASYTGVSEAVAANISVLHFNQAVCGSVAAERQLIAIEDVQNSCDPKTELIRALEITAFASYPLIAQGQLYGTLGFGSRTRIKFSQNEIGMMQAVCDLIAIAIERSRLLGSLQQQTDQLRDTNRMKDEFLAILSHELRSPLNSILGWSQLLIGRPNLDDAKKSQALETIERNARAQKQLIEDLLDISRIIRGKLRLNVAPCNLVPIVEAAIETVRIAAEAKQIEVIFTIQDSSWQASQKVISQDKDEARQSSIFNPKLFVKADAERLQQVTWNLLSNAIKFTGVGGQVEIKLIKLSEVNSDTYCGAIDQVLIQVKDNGIGIEPDFIPYVFDRFRQADSSSTRTHGGLGLGLAIVKHLVELHGGSVAVESQGVAKGATFTVKLPLLTNEHINSNLHTIPSSNTPSPALTFLPSLEGVRVLVVDDEADTRNFVVTVLEQSYAQVQAAASVQEALELISNYKPDVIVSDIGMPGEDGYSLIRKIRNLPSDAGGNIPAAALTAYARASDRLRAIREGFQLHLPKPIEAAELTTVVASLVGRT